MFIRSRPLLTTLLSGAVALAVSVPAAQAQRGGWGWGPGWGDPFGYGSGGPVGGPDRSREGKISVARFVSKVPLAAQLGHGSIAVSTNDPNALDLGESDRIFNAAMTERLAKAGYQTGTPGVGTDAGQVIELTITRTELEPQEPPHKPVSGEAEMGVSNHGSGFGLAVNVDLSKPLPPLIATRLEARIRDRATNTVLWEGRAEVATRPGTKGWNDQQIATRLAAALLDGFPHAADKVDARGG